MEWLILLPGIIAIIDIKRRSIADALIDVFVPSFLLLPSIYWIHIPHLPLFGFSDSAMIPIGIATIFVFRRNWKFQRADLWMATFIVGLYCAEYQRTGATNAGEDVFTAIVAGLLPYAVGKLLLEQDGMRERFVRRFVLLLFFVSIVSAWEFRMGTNLFTKFFGMLIPDEKPWIAQIRGGLTRIAGPFTASILGGMVLLVGVLLSLWLAFVDKQRGDEKKYAGVRKSVILSLGIMAGLYMTRSRGPWIGAILGFLIARIGRAKNIRRAVIVTSLICIVGGTVGYIKAEQYTSGSIWAAKDVEQENAIYRRMLLDNYKPIIEKSGLFGYGIVDWPRVPGQSSIDNEFLFLEITQGKIGYWSIILLCLEAAISVIRAVRKSAQPVDIFFALSIGGSIAGLVLSLTTVYMGAQSYPLFFLLIGWSQSLRQTQSAAVAVPEAESSRLRFRRVFA